MNQPARGRSCLGTVVIPAHDEEAVVGRLLQSLRTPSSTGIFDIIVVCNGCTDNTAEIAGQYQSVRIVEIAQPSKTAALNMGIRMARRGPVLFVDADVMLSGETAKVVLGFLDSDSVLAARPQAMYDTVGAQPVVRSYYRGRAGLASRHQHLWGAGVYGLSSPALERLGSFPSVIADDLWVDRMFSESEIFVLDVCSAVVVASPRNCRSLLRTLRRVYRGNRQFLTESRQHRRSSQSKYGEVTQAVRDHGLEILPHLAVYFLLSCVGRMFARVPQKSRTWERDDSSRSR